MKAFFRRVCLYVHVAFHPDLRSRTRRSWRMYAMQWPAGRPRVEAGAAKK